MIDIRDMIKTNNFSTLLNSTQQERDAAGGNQYIYIQLTSYIHFQLICDVLKHTFQNDSEIMYDIYKRCHEKEKENDLSFLINTHKVNHNQFI